MIAILFFNRTYICILLQNAKYLDAIYDLTIVFPDVVPQNEGAVIMGMLPSKVHINVKKYSSKELPTDERELGRWLEKRWEEKEARISEFFETRQFSAADTWRTNTYSWQMIFVIGWFASQMGKNCLCR